MGDNCRDGKQQRKMQESKNMTVWKEKTWINFETKRKKIVKTIRN